MDGKVELKPIIHDFYEDFQELESIYLYLSIYF